MLTAKVSGFDEIALTGLPSDGLKVPPKETLTVPVQVSTIPEYADKGSHPIVFEFTYRESGSSETSTLTEKSSFIGE